MPASTVQVERLPIRRHAPQAYRALIALDAAVRGLDPGLRELVRLRASQLNGCSFCVDLHTTAAKRAGETDRRLHAVVVWREAPFFTETERAALWLTEAITRLDDRDALEAAYLQAARVFRPDELAQLVMAIAIINAFNRIGVASGMAPERPSLASYRVEVGRLLSGEPSSKPNQQA